MGNIQTSPLRIDLNWTYRDKSLVHIFSSPNGEIANKMSYMEGQIRNAVGSGCSNQVGNLGTYMESIWWPNIQYLASRTSAEEQQQVLRNYANLQYMMGLVLPLILLEDGGWRVIWICWSITPSRTRKCQSDQETFYEGQCYPVGTADSPCPRNQQLYDRPDNMGYCYCQRGLSNYVYMDGECYQENEQVTSSISFDSSGRFLNFAAPRDLAKTTNGSLWMRIGLLRASRSRERARLMANTFTGVVAPTRNANVKREPTWRWNAADWAVNNLRAGPGRNCTVAGRPTIAAGPDWRSTIGWNRILFCHQSVSRRVLPVSKYRPCRFLSHKCPHRFASVLGAIREAGMAAAEEPCNSASIIAICK